MSQTRTRRLTFLAATALIAAASLAVAQQQPPAGSADADTILVRGLTSPSDVRKIGFDIPGVVAKVEVKKNDAIKAGQPLISLNDAEEQATLKGYEIAADPKLAVAEAEQTLAVKQLEYERKAAVYKTEPNGSSEREMKSAEAERNIAQIKIDQARENASQAQAKADAQSARIARMHKLVPADFGDGQVSDVLVKQGEQVDQNRPALEIVDLDPLYVDVTFAETGVVQHLKLGQTIPVKYGDEGKWREAVVDAIDPSADKKTGTHPFRLRLPNPEHRNAGLAVEVRLPRPPAMAAGQ